MDPECFKNITIPYEARYRQSSNTLLALSFHKSPLLFAPIFFMPEDCSELICGNESIYSVDLTQVDFKNTENVFNMIAENKNLRYIKLYIESSVDNAKDMIEENGDLEAAAIGIDSPELDNVNHMLVKNNNLRTLNISLTSAKLREYHLTNIYYKCPNIQTKQIRLNGKESA